MLTTSIRLSNFIRTRPIRARTGFHPASETAAVRAETPMRGARPTGPKNPPGACGATPLPERARTGAAIPPAKLHWRTWVWGPARQIRINKNLAPLHASFPMGRRRRRRRRYETVSNPCGPRRSPPPSRPEAGTSPHAFPRPPPPLLQPPGGGAVAKATLRERLRSFPLPLEEARAGRRCHGDVQALRAASRFTSQPGGP